MTVIHDLADQPWHDQTIVSATTHPRFVGEATLESVNLVINGAISLELLAVATSDCGAEQMHRLKSDFSAMPR